MSLATHSAKLCGGVADVHLGYWTMLVQPPNERHQKVEGTHKAPNDHCGAVPWGLGGKMREGTPVLAQKPIRSQSAIIRDRDGRPCSEIAPFSEIWSP
jgi:hypothetical protein